jgi:hypothetical protein
MASDFSDTWHLHWTRDSHGCPCQGLPWNNLPCLGMDVRPPCERGLSNVRRNGFPFRHELRLRVLRAKLGTELFEPLIDSTQDLRTCLHCLKMAPKMRHCSGCKWARYCDRKCQKVSWGTHRTECCPDHSLPKYQRNTHLPHIRYQSLAAYRRAEWKQTALTMAVSALTVPSVISAPSSSSGSLNAASTQPTTQPISRHEVSHTIGNG